MRIVEQIAATTHVDQHGDRLTRRALRSMLRQIERRYLWSYLEHDYRNPPIGRTAGGYVKELKDGNLALITRMEIFDANDVGMTTNDTKECVIRIHPRDNIEIEYDRSYSRADYMELVSELQDALDSKTQPREELKKALEPLSFLMIAGSFVLGSMASGFFNKIGADGWDKLNAILPRIIKKRREDSKEYVLTFDFTVEPQQGKPFTCQIHFTNPKENEIADSLKTVLADAENTVTMLSTARRDISKVCFDVVNGSARLSYVVGRSGIPTEVRDIAAYDELTKRIAEE